jgi:PPOX class probable F420-dependent enzyme
MIAAEKYVSLTTRKKDGTTVSSPVWIAALPDGRVGFSTGSTTGKVKRIRNFPEVTLQPCDSRGRVAEGASVITGRATIVEGADYEPVQAAIRAKYGLMFTILTGSGRLWSKLRRRVEVSVGVAIELDAA